MAGRLKAEQAGGGGATNGRSDMKKDGFIISLDNYTVSTGKSSATYTRMRSPFRNTRDMQMNIYRASIFTGLGKLLGMSDITVGDAMFDEHFVVQGKPESTIKAFLRDPKIRALSRAQPEVAYRIKPDAGWFSSLYPEGMHVRHAVRDGRCRDAAGVTQL